MGFTGKLKINNKNEDYLIHGQPFSLKFEFTDIKWGILFYRPGSMSSNLNKSRLHVPGSNFFNSNISPFQYFKFFKNSNEIELISNAYFPQIRFFLFKTTFSFFPIKFNLPLKINFVNTREIDTSTEIEIFLKKNAVQLDLPVEPILDWNIQIAQNKVVLNPLEISIRDHNISISNNLLNP